MTNNEIKWYNQYIKDIDINKISWIILTDDELQTFYKENYFDKENNSYVYTTNLDKQNPFGLFYLTFDSLAGLKYLLGVVPNNINKLTIIAALAFNDNYYLYSDQQEPITYISTVETNKYFRNQGIFKQLVLKAIEYNPSYQNILFSDESDMGKLCHVEEIATKLLQSSKYPKDARSDTKNFND